MRSLDYPAALDLLNSLPSFEQHPAGHRFSLARFRRFLKLIGSPHRKLRNVILVAGTKGKGSTCAIIDSVLRAAGYPVGLYTSPHLLDVRERIRLNGEPIAEADFCRQVRAIQPALKQEPVTWFEALTAVAFLHLAHWDPTFTILEVGLGGRLDATNVVTPKVSVITCIGLDHTEILGKTIPEIAREKAGIMRPGHLVAIAPQLPGARRALDAEVTRLDSRVVFTEDVLRARDALVSPLGTTFTLESRLPEFTLCGSHATNLIGRHQVENVLNAITALILLRYACGPERLTDLGPEALRTGLLTVPLRARCQIVRRYPLLIVDSAHNPDSIQALVKTLKDLKLSRVTFIVGMLRDKPARKLLTLLKPLGHEFILVEPDSPRALSITRLARDARALGLQHQAAGRLTAELLISDRPLVVTGSFYLAGQALRLLGLDAS